MKKRRLALILAVSMVLAGCGGAAEPSGETTAEPVPEETKSEGEAAAEQAAEGSEAAAADSFGRYEEPVTFTVALEVDPNEVFPEGDSYTDNQYTRYIKEQLNVDIEYLFTASTSDWDTKVNLAITSNQIPDAMPVNATQFNQMYKAGQLADMTDVYEMYASDTMRAMVDSSEGLAVENASYGGRMYGLTYTSDGDYELTWIRKDWLDKLGLEEPKTIEDLEAVARTVLTAILMDSALIRDGGSLRATASRYMDLLPERQEMLWKNWRSGMRKD